MACIYLGTSSWSHKGWRGTFYPEGVGANRYLHFYARQLMSVEVNTSFYALPTPSVLIQWVESVPDGFRFALKAPKQITHEKRLVDCGAESRAFLETLRSLGDACAPALLQLPPTFTRRQHGRALATYLDWLAMHMDGLNFAVEVRSRDLMTREFAQFLADRGITLALVDRVDTPDLYEVLAVIDGGPDFVYIRWIGDDRAGPTGDDSIVAPQDEKLDLWADRLLALHDADKRVYGYMHNPYEGHAPESIRRLQHRLARHGLLPAWPPDVDDGDALQMSLL